MKLQTWIEENRPDTPRGYQPYTTMIGSDYHSVVYYFLNKKGAWNDKAFAVQTPERIIAMPCPDWVQVEDYDVEFKSEAINRLKEFYEQAMKELSE
jgi:hypothetical protein